MKGLAVLLAVCLAAPALADIVTLNDGTVVEGVVRKTAEGYVVTDASGRSIAVAAADVRSMGPGRSASNARTPESELVTLRRSLVGARDPAQVVERYKAFIARQPQGSVSSDAGKDLAQWQERLDKGLVRVGDAWITPAERDERRAQSAAAIAEAAPLIDAGKVGEADTVLTRALSLNPDDPSLMYLKGLVLFGEVRIVPARKAFEAVIAAIPNHAASHNNIAVILWQNHAPMPALGEYEKAMIAEPGNQQVLDNVAEALHDLPAAAAKNELVVRVARRFAAQDALLQKTMAERGMRRIGSRWLTTDDFNALQASRVTAREKVEAYKKEARDLPPKLTQMDTDIALKTDAINGITQHFLFVDERTGRVTQGALPQRYYDLKQEIENLSAERAFKQRRLSQLPKLTLEAEQAMMANDFTGVQKLIGASGIGGAPSPATQPTTRPS